MQQPQTEHVHSWRFEHFPMFRRMTCEQCGAVLTEPEIEQLINHHEQPGNEARKDINKDEPRLFVYTVQVTGSDTRQVEVTLSQEDVSFGKIEEMAINVFQEKFRNYDNYEVSDVEYVSAPESDGHITTLPVDWTPD